MICIRLLIFSLLLLSPAALNPHNLVGKQGNTINALQEILLKAIEIRDPEKRKNFLTLFLSDCAKGIALYNTSNNNPNSEKAQLTSAKNAAILAFLFHTFHETRKFAHTIEQTNALLEAEEEVLNVMAQKNKSFQHVLPFLKLLFLEPHLKGEEVRTLVQTLKLTADETNTMFAEGSRYYRHIKSLHFQRTPEGEKQFKKSSETLLSKWKQEVDGLREQVRGLQFPESSSTPPSLQKEDFPLPRSRRCYANCLRKRMEGAQSVPSSLGKHMKNLMPQNGGAEDQNQITPFSMKPF